MSDDLSTYAAPVVPAEALHNCTNCGGPVRARRRSATGLHFCAARLCQNAKQRTYRKQREAAADEGLERRQEVFLGSIIAEALSGDRWRTCGTCGAERVLAGWVHRKLGEPVMPCFGIGSSGVELGALRGTVMDAVMPHLAPTAQQRPAQPAPPAQVVSEPVAPPAPAPPAPVAPPAPAPPAPVEQPRATMPPF